MKTNNQKKYLQIIAGFFAFMLIINCSSDSDSGSGDSSGTPTPMITLTGNFSSFGAVDAGSDSASQSVQVSASDLTSNLIIKASNNYKVSLDNSTFTNQVALSKTDANAGSNEVYVRFSPTDSAIGVVVGNLTFESSQAITKTLSLTGESISITPVITAVGEFEHFGDVSIMENSDSQSIVINGDNLVSEITLSASGDFKVSLDDAIFSDSVQVPTSSVNDNVTVYVRFSPTTVGSAFEGLSIANAEADNLSQTLEANGTPVTHTYPAFNETYLGFGGGYSQSAEQVFTLRDDLSNIQQIKMFLKIDCPSTGCDDWDRFANVKVKDPATGNWFEIGRYITPYWVGTELLERGLEFDVTDFKSLLTGNTELRIYIENWTAKADIISIEFDYLEGTPDYPYYAVSEVLGYHINSIDGVPYGVDHNFDLDKQISISANAESAHLRTVISGWGHANGTPGSNCAEWCIKTHDIKINGVDTFSHYLGPIGCSSNPINNQAPGNWQPDRAGWCPGMVVPVREDQLNGMAGSSFTFEYDYEDWTNDGSNGNAYYATSTYVVVKSNSAIVSPTVTD